MTEQKTIGRDFFTTPDPDLKPQKVEFPGIGLVNIRKLSAAEWAKDVQLWMQEDPNREFIADLRIVELGTSDDEGKPLFTESDYEKVSECKLGATISSLAMWIAGEKVPTVERKTFPQLAG